MPAWTCFIMGSENGQLSFYNEFGYELLVLRFANSPVRQLTLCPKANDTDMHRQSGELFILHSRSLISVSELELRSVLQICSLCLVKDISPAPKKISFSRLLIEHHDQVSGIVPLGVSRPSLYDHLFNRSVSCGRFEYSELPEEQINFALSGCNPFFAFHSAPLRRQTTGLFQIASFLTSEARRAVFGESKSNQGLVRWTSFGVDYRAPSCAWLVGSNSSSTEDTSLRLIHGVADRRRKLEGTLDYSSDRRWAACPDNLGRVVLIDLRKGVAVRFFKGYRNAEVAFVEVSEEEAVSSGQGLKRRTQFLVILDPHRKILVCYNVAHGSEVFCRRLTDFPAKLVKLPLIGTDKAPVEGLLIVTKSGNFYKLDLGFDLCVTGASRKLAAHKAHDYRITLDIGKLVEATGNASLLVDGTQLAGQKLFELIEQFRHAVSLEKCVLRLISERRIAKNPSYVQLLITKVIKSLKRAIANSQTNDGLVSGSSEAENLLLLHRLKSYLSQVSTFSRFKKLLLQSLSDESVSEETPEALADNLAWDSEDASKCFFVYEMIEQEFDRGSNPEESTTHVPSLGVYFNSTKLVYLPLRSAESELSSHSDGLEAPSVRILVSGKTNAKPEHIAELGTLFFGPYLQGRALIEDWQECYQASSLHPEFGFHLLLSYFLRDERYGSIAQTATRLKNLFIILLADFLTVNRDSFFARQGQGSTDSLDSTSSLLTGAQSSLFEELCRLLSFVHSQCGHCHQLTAAYLVMITMRAVLYDMCAQSEDEAPPRNRTLQGAPERSKSRKPDIPLVDLMKVMQKWHLNCSRMETILCCYAMLLHRPQLTDESNVTPAGTQMLQTSIISQRGVSNQRIFEQIFRESLSLQSVSTQGRKLLADMFSRWLLFWRLSPEQVIALYQEMCLRNGDQVKEHYAFSAQTLELFSVLYEHLPCTLQMDHILATVAYEYALKWNEERPLGHGHESLRQAIAFARRLGSAGSTVALGLLTTIWRYYLHAEVQKLVHNLLIPKTEKKGILKQSSSEKINQLSFALTLIDFFSLYCKLRESQEVVPIFSMESEWEEDKTKPLSSSQSLHTSDSMSSFGGMYGSSVAAEAYASTMDQSVAQRLTLAEVAADQSSYALPMESMSSISQLMLSCSLVLTFPRISSGIVDLFTPQDVHSLNTDFHLKWSLIAPSKLAPEGEKFLHLNSKRRDFLNEIISLVVAQYSRSLLLEQMEQKNPAPVSRVLSTQDAFETLVGAVLKLAEYWSISRSKLWCLVISDLCEQCLDREASSHFDQVPNEDWPLLASTLLTVVGRRFHYLMQDCESAAMTQVNLETTRRILRLKNRCSMQLNAWISSMVEYQEPISSAIGMDRVETKDLINSRFSSVDKAWRSLISLIDFVIDNIPASSNQHNIANELRELVDYFLEQ